MNFTISQSDWYSIGVVALLIGVSAFFSGSETGMTAASRATLTELERQGSKRAGIVLKLTEMPERLIGALLLGNSLANITASALATVLMVKYFGSEGAVISSAVMTVLIVIFAEVMPKTLAISYPERVSLAISRIVAFFVAIFGPVLIGVEALVRGVLRILGVPVGHHSSILSGHEELKSAVDLMHKEGNVGRDDRDMFGGLLDLDQLNVQDVMVHRTKMRTINADLPPDELVREVLASPYTRLPLWRNEPENIIGVLHAKDLLRGLQASGGEASSLRIDDLALEAWFVPATTPVRDQLQGFLKRKTHFALVVDEYGEVMGLVTLEDILEEIVGDIRDEHDLAVQGVRQFPDGSVTVDGSVPIRDVNRVMDWSLPDEEATTIAGLVIHEARSIPEPGQVFTFHGFRFEVLRKTRNRITSLRILPVQRTRD